MQKPDETRLLEYPSRELKSYLYSEYSEKVYNLAYRMTGDEELSHDITQETFIKVFEKIAGFEGRSAVYTWIYTIAKNICLQRIKNRNRQSFRPLEELIKTAASPPEPEQYDELEKSYYIKQVKEGCLLGVLRCLSLYQRLSFILNILLELPIKDVAEIIDKSENSTRILVHRARKRIREFLCTNCTLYAKENSCHCENLVSFSLKQGWIELYTPSYRLEEIEEEIIELKDEIGLYRSLPPRENGRPLTEALSLLINDGEKKIFSEKKVK